MIIWVDTFNDDTRLRAYDHKLRHVATMSEIDNGEKWRIEHYKETHEMPASGCPDPVAFIMALISPRNTDPYDDLPFLSFVNHDTNETVEVWELI